MTNSVDLIKIDNNDLFVRGDADTLSLIAENYSYREEGYQHSNAYKKGFWDGKKRLFSKQTNKLPFGLRDSLIEFLKKEKIEYDVEDRDDVMFPEAELEDEQVNSYIDVLEKNLPFSLRDFQKKSIIDAIRDRRKSFISPTGSGKTVIIYLLTKIAIELLEKNKVLLVVPTLGLIEQTSTDFESYGETSNYVYKIHQGVDKENIDRSVVISTYQSIYNQPVEWFEQFDFIIGDECHKFKADSLQLLMRKSINADYRIGFTGTLGNTEMNEMVVQGLFGSKQVLTTNKELQKKKIHPNLKIHILDLLYSKKEIFDLRKRKALVDKKKGPAAKYFEESSFLSEHHKRNLFIANLAVNQKKNTLILFKLVEKHGIPLFNLIKERNTDPNRFIEFISGDISATERERIRQQMEKRRTVLL